jgi:biofilm PGA synthesis protein PgaA
MNSSPPRTLRRKVVGHLVAALLGLLCICSPAMAGQATASELEHEAAILAARSGQFSQALDQLQRLRLENPQDRSLLIDQTLVFAWANLDQQVVDNASQLYLTSDPVQVITAVAKAYRNLKKFDNAVHWYQGALTREPDNLDARLGMAMSLTDGKRYEEAVTTLAVLADPQQNSAPALKVRAYLLKGQGKRVQRLAVYDALLALEPASPEILREKALLLGEMMLPEYALELARQYPGILSQQEMDNLEGDQLALSIRSAARTYSSPGSAPVKSEQALAMLDSHIASVPPDTPLYRRLRTDRLVALVDAGHAAEAVAEYEALTAEGMQPANNIRFAAARAYLANGQAETALLLLTECLAAEPDNLDYQEEYFYALLDTGQLDRAIAYADEIQARQASGPGGIDQAGDLYMNARLRSILARSYADQLELAQAELEAITREAPNNVDARQELASIYLWRGWPDKALAQYQQILTMYPEHLGARAGWSRAQLARQDYPAADVAISDLQKDYPESRPVTQLARTWQLHEKSQLVVEASTGDSTGDTFGSRQYTLQGWWYTPPKYDWFRFYAHTFDSFAEFPEGDGERSRIAAGAEYRRPGWDARGEVSTRRWGGDAGLHAELNWHVSDLWTVGAGAELNSYETPLRADLNGVSSDQLAFRARYNPNESISVGSTLTLASFDDNNRRRGLLVYGRQRAVNKTWFKLDGTASAYFSSNSKELTSYYNPSGDRSLIIGADMRWIVFRGADRGLYHRLHPQFGSYYQDSYGSNPIWSLEYEFGMRFNDSWSLNLGARRGRHAYDGGMETSNTLLLGLEGRL